MIHQFIPGNLANHDELVHSLQVLKAQKIASLGCSITFHDVSS
jgi:hypothetical protein